jgi:uncharacterized protein involved in outer membrane biogenesis
MKKPYKIAIAVAAGLLVLMVVAMLLIDGIARAGIQAGASYALGVKTTLASAHVGLLSGQFTLGGLRVENPPACRTDHFLTLSRGELDVSLGSLLRDTLTVPLLELDGFDVNLERGSDGRSNYSVILDNLSKAESDAGGGAPKEKKDPADQAPKGGRKLIIREIRLKDIRATVTLFSLGGSPQLVPVRLPELRLKDVGTDGNGVSVAQLSGKLVQAIVVGVIQAGGSLIPAEFGRDVARVADSVKLEAGKAVQGAGSLKEEAGKALQGIGDLFRKKK